MADLSGIPCRVCPTCGQSVFRGQWADRAFRFIEDELDLTREDLCGMRNSRALTEARRLFVWVMLTYRPSLSDRAIGVLLGHRDRTTIRHHRHVLRSSPIDRDLRRLCDAFARLNPIPEETIQ